MVNLQPLFLYLDTTFRIFLIKIDTWEQKVPVGFLEREDVPALMGRLGCIEVIKLIFEGHKSILRTF